MKLSWLIVVAAVVALAAGACSSDTKAGGDAAAGTTGSGGATGSAGTTGTAGTTGSGGTTGSAGTTGSGGGGGGGEQPIGSVCGANNHCSQADGIAICCLQIPACTLVDDCPTSPNYVSCETTPCTKAGWICCNAGGMRFCTKQNGCPTP